MPLPRRRPDPNELTLEEVDGAPSPTVTDGSRTQASSSARRPATGSSEAGGPEAVLNRRFELVANKFERLCSELHIPFLDCKLYAKYVLGSRTEENLVSLCLLTKLMLDHKKRTMTVLELIQRREVVVMCILALTNDFSKGRISTLELQGKVLRMLHALQQITLKTIEAVDRWRAPLTRPFPFQFRNVNYLLKMLLDNRLMASSHLGQVLPLRMQEFPLCSHLPSLTLFTAELQNAPGFVAYPLSANKKAAIPSVSAKQMQARLRRAEAYLKNEPRQQLVLLAEQLRLCEQGMFLPIVNTTIVPSCATGISLRSRVWLARLHQALLKSINEVNTLCTMPLPQDYTSNAFDGHLKVDMGAYEDVHDVGDEEDDDPEEAELEMVSDDEAASY